MPRFIDSYAEALSRRLSRFALPLKVSEGHRFGTSLLIVMLTAYPAIADPQPSSIYAALQSQRNKCQDESALAIASNIEELAKVKAELEALKKDFGVK